MSDTTHGNYCKMHSIYTRPLDNGVLGDLARSPNLDMDDPLQIFSVFESDHTYQCPTNI